MRNPIFSLALAGAALMAAGQAAAAQVYVLGHEDDWQLFMGQKGFDDVASNETVVFVYLTAGDAGWGNTGWNSTPVYRAREEGAIASTHVPTSTLTQWYPSDKASTLLINKHYVRRIQHKNTYHYFFRLPDGGTDGNGYERTKFQSIKKLREGTILTLNAVDGSTKYTSYADLTRTLTTLLDQFPVSTINGTDIDGTVNPGSHPDHYESTLLAINAYNYGTSLFRFWRDYSIANDAPNISTDDLIKKSTLLGAMAHGMSLRNYYGVYHPWHNQFLPRSSFREVPAPVTVVGKR